MAERCAQRYGLQIPPDILNLIQETIYADSGCDTKISIILSHVALSWRREALSNPRLWNHIYISYPWNAIALEACIKRCKRYPLDIKVVFKEAFIYGDEGHENFRASLWALGNHLIAHHDHLQQIEIRDHSGDVLVPSMLDILLRELSDMELPLLQGLVLDAGDTVITYGGPLVTIPLLSSAKKLTKLALGPSALFHYSFPLTTLTTLHLLPLRTRNRGSALPIIDTVHKLLSQCKNLTQLIIDDTDPYYDWAKVLERIPPHLRLLRSIRFHGQFGPSWPQFTALENLQELLVFPLSNSTWTLRLGIEHNAQVFAKLTTFGTNIEQDLPDQHRTLISLSKHLPCLTHLIIAVPNGEIQFPARLLHIFPRLCELTLINVSAKSIDLLSMIVSGFYTKRQFPPFETLYLEKGNLKKLKDEESLRDDYPFEIKEADARHVPATWASLS